MIRLSKYQRLALLAASTTVITGGVLSQGAAFAAPAAPHPASVTAAGHVDAATQWKQVTDTPSGITVQLPGKPRTQENTDNQISCRDYVVPTGYGAIGFSVYDGPASEANKPWDLEAGLKNAVDGYNSGDPGARLRSTDVHDGTKDGHRYLEAKLVGADGRVGHIRLVDLGQRAIIIEDVGNSDQRDSVDHDYQQVLDSIKLPDHSVRQAQDPAVAT
ncbi:hypothetical protein [Streptomyces fodineus]|nr:hypothetical protein [Streptomyces fodineus]